VDRPYTIAPERTNDKHIMDWIIESKKFHDKDIRILNYCRLYLNVTTISELFDATGKHMLPLMYQCQRPNWFNRHQFIILQRRPSQYQIDRKWKAFCHYWCEPKTLKRHESINLGEWHPTQKYRPWRQTYVDTSRPNQTIYHYHDQHYWTLTRIPNRYGNYTLHEPTPWTPTIHAMPIQLRTGQSTTLEYTRNYDDNHNVPTVFARNVSNYMRTQTDPRPKSSFPQYISSLPPWQQSIFQTINMEFPLDEIIEKIQQESSNNRPLTSLSFGTSANRCIVHGWMLTTLNGKPLVVAGTKTAPTMTKQRAAALALLSSMTFLEVAFNFKGIPLQGNLQLHCTTNNQKLVNRMSKRQNYADPYANETLTPDWDLTEQCHVLASTLTHHPPLYYSCFESHSPDLNDTNKVLKLETKHLKQHRQLLLGLAKRQPVTPETDIPLLSAAKCQASIQGIVLRSDYARKYREAATLPQLFGYLKDKLNTTADSIQDINWGWFKIAVSRYQRASHNHLVKLVYRQLATPDQKTKAGGQTWIDPTCRHCTTGETETFDHMLRCNSPEAIPFRRDVVTRLTKYYPTWVPPRFRETFINGLEHWLWRSDTIPNTNALQAITRVYSQQALIGWHGFARGFLSRAWGPYLLFALEETNATTTQPTERSPDINIDNFFSQLIYEIWAAQSDFWKLYQHNRHTPSTKSSNDQHLHVRQELQNTVRYLESMRTQIEPGSVEYYFLSAFHRERCQRTYTAWVRVRTIIVMEVTLRRNYPRVISRHPQ
jgi:hypothetical protein